VIKYLETVPRILRLRLRLTAEEKVYMNLYEQASKLEYGTTDAEEDFDAAKTELEEKDECLGDCISDDPLTKEPWISLKTTYMEKTSQAFHRCIRDHLDRCTPSCRNEKERYSKSEWEEWAEGNATQELRAEPLAKEPSELDAAEWKAGELLEALHEDLLESQPEDVEPDKQDSFPGRAGQQDLEDDVFAQKLQRFFN